MLATLKKKFSAFAKNHFGNNKKGGKQLFCSQPWEFFTVNPEGDVYPCRCLMWGNKSIGNLLKQNPWEIWNSNEAQRIRMSIVKGAFTYCNKDCPYLEFKLLPDKEQVHGSFYRTIISDKKLTLDCGPRVVFPAVDRACNLQCEYCSEIRKNLGPVLPQRAHRIYQSLSTDAFLKDAHFLLIGGPGEPLVSQSHLLFLENTDFSMYPQLKIKLFTNGLLLNVQLWQRLGRNCKLISEISISIDAATEHMYKRMRPGGDWHALLENLRFISQLRKDGRVDQFAVSFVVQNDNYKEMKKFVEMGKQLQCDCIKFTHLINFGTFSESEYKQKAIHKKTHPENKEFTRYLDDPMFDDPRIRLRTPLRAGLQQ